MMKTSKPIPTRRSLFAKTAGLTLVELLALISLIGILAAIAIPNFIRARTTASKNTCLDINLWQIHYAKQLWAEENKKAVTDIPTQSELIPYLRNSWSFLCPANGSYTIGPVGSYPTCSQGAAMGHTLNPASQKETQAMFRAMKARRRNRRKSGRRPGPSLVPADVRAGPGARATDP